MATRIAILGATGLLGSNLIDLYSTYPDIEAQGFSRSHKTNIPEPSNTIVSFDSSQATWQEALSQFQPDLIINCIGLVNLAKCEENPDLANGINAELPKQFANFCKNTCKFIHISTDHFFDDNLEFHNENTPVVLLNNYARSKFKGETLVLEEYPEALIFRTNIIGFRRTEYPSFFEWLLTQLKTQSKTTLFTDFVTSPIHCQGLGKVILESFSTPLSGLFNVGSRTPISKYDFGKLTAEQFDLPFDHVKKGQLDQFENSIKRGHSLGLSVDKIESSLGKKMPSIQEVILNLKKES